MRKVLFPVALGIGLLIAYVDSRPNWDDSGITALALFTASAACGALSPKRCWLWALAIGMWIPVQSIVMSGNYSSVLVLVFSFAGAYAGLAGRKMMSHASEAT
jgi:hypothetical protein